MRAVLPIKIQGATDVLVEKASPFFTLVGTKAVTPLTQLGDRAVNKAVSIIPGRRPAAIVPVNWFQRVRQASFRSVDAIQSYTNALSDSLKRQQDVDQFLQAVQNKLKDAWADELVAPTRAWYFAAKDAFQDGGKEGASRAGGDTITLHKARVLQALCDSKKPEISVYNRCVGAFNILRARKNKGDEVGREEMTQQLRQDMGRGFREEFTDLAGVFLQRANEKVQRDDKPLDQLPEGADPLHQLGTGPWTFASIIYWVAAVLAMIVGVWASVIHKLMDVVRLKTKPGYEGERGTLDGLTGRVLYNMQLFSTNCVKPVIRVDPMAVVVEGFKRGMANARLMINRLRQLFMSSRPGQAVRDFTSKAHLRDASDAVMDTPIRDMPTKGLAAASMAASAAVNEVRKRVPKGSKQGRAQEAETATQG